MRVAVIGGGYAGMAAAVTLAQAGVAVTVYEAGSQLGGRARRVTVNGVALDNGLSHPPRRLRRTFALIRLVHPSPERALDETPARLAHSRPLSSEGGARCPRRCISRRAC